MGMDLYIYSARNREIFKHDDWWKSDQVQEEFYARKFWDLVENCSNSGVYCSECHTKVFDNYPFKKKFSYFCPHCGTRMEGEIERR